jgi:4-amino-4-deoxy-L-arabinose transferase-like glycosyltransferase
MGMLGHFLNRKCDLSVSNRVLLYKQLIRLMIDYACPAWRPAARSHVRRLQVLQSKCLRLATGAPWYLSNRQIHEDLGVPLFADHIRALTAGFDSKLDDVENPLVRELGSYLRWPRFDPVAWRVSQGRQEAAGQSRPSPAMAKSTKRIAFGADQPGAFRVPWLRFFRDFPQL